MWIQNTDTINWIETICCLTLKSKSGCKSYPHHRALPESISFKTDLSLFCTPWKEYPSQAGSTISCCKRKIICRSAELRSSRADPEKDGFLRQERAHCWLQRMINGGGNRPRSLTSAKLKCSVHSGSYSLVAGKLAAASFSREQEVWTDCGLRPWRRLSVSRSLRSITLYWYSQHHISSSKNEINTWLSGKSSVIRVVVRHE